MIFTGHVIRTIATHPDGRGRNNRGSVLMLTILAVLLLTIMAVSIITVTTNALYLGKVRRCQTEAFDYAESGAEMATIWFRNQSSAPSTLSDFDPFGGAQTLEGGEYEVTVHPDPDNGAHYLKTYTITSVGTAAGNSKTVEVVIRQATFGRFAYFTDQEVSSISGGTIWWKAGEICDGPAHSNNTSGSNFHINYNGSTAPIFRDMLTGSGPSISYQPSSPTDEATYRRIFEDGSTGYKLGVPRIELPESTTVQRNAAWGGSSGFPGSNGVYVKANSNNGGIYVRGDCSMLLSRDGSGAQRIAITQGGNTTTMVVNLGNQTTTITKPNGTTETQALPNGVIYCTGNITSLKGVVADNRVVSGEIDKRMAMTIATDVTNGKDITITDDLTYYTTPDKTQPASDSDNLRAGTLGLVAEDIKISSSAPRYLEIDAVCLAGGRDTSAGSFYVQNWDSRQPTGTLSVLGGIIQKARGPVGTFNSSTGNMTTGFAKNYSYDPRLAEDPPPYFPTTGTYERLSWRVVP